MVTIEPPHYIEAEDLSCAWAQAFLAVRAHREICCLVVSVTGFDNGRVIETGSIRSALDAALLTAGKQSVHTVSNTIFPVSQWNRGAPRQQLYERYAKIITRLRRKHPGNRYGIYFERMIAHGDGAVNQLEYIIETRSRGNHRRSALQAVVLDPARDHTDQPLRGFPCLTQVAFTPDSDGGLTVTGFYPMQYVFERAYGNYLGLSRLGEFMATEMRLELRRVTCVATIAARDYTVRATEPLAATLRGILDEQSGRVLQGPCE